ncbi:sensor histidine kinase [Methylosarcina fibrata]|uniref:sensor histidine kinase n=1 Tax=Methylosarcina fibrata TaxID=105972 RepID=UPI00037E7567|nr:sensor histidine kinase [Methylosarcina fibrata]
MSQIFPLTEKKMARQNPVAYQLVRSSSVWTLVLIFCCLIATTLISYKAISGLIEDYNWVLHTQEVIEKNLQFLADVRAAESRKRGYIITGDSRYLDKFYDALNEIEKHGDQLAALVADNPSRKKEVNTLRNLVDKRKQEFQDTIAIFKKNGYKVPTPALIQQAEFEINDDINRLSEKISQSEKQLLKDRRKDSIHSKDFALRGLFIGAALTTALIIFSYYLIYVDLRRRQDLIEELAQARDALEEKVGDRTQELERSNRELQEFAYIASHDLQEPLRKIQVFGDRLKTRSGAALDETSRDYLERMQKAAKRMHTLINDLLQFSRVSSSSLMVNKVFIDLNEQVDEVISDLEGSIEVTQGQICIGNLPEIQADPVQVRQLLQNILSNALKFHQPNVPPKITVNWHNQTGFETGKPPPEFYEIAVTDNGIGIDPQYEEKIFKPFQRLHTKNEYEGTGIGLAVCRKIIEGHQGFIRIMPAPSGQGTTFLIGFPALQESEVAS